MLHADVGHVAVIGGLRALVRDPHHDMFDLFGLDPVRPDEIEQGVEGRLDRRADRPALDVSVHDLVGGAELAHQFIRIRLAAVGDEEVALAGEDVLHPGEAGGDHGRGGDPVAGRHAAEIERLLDVLGVARPGRDAGGLLRGERQQVAHLSGLEAGEGAGRGGSTEHGPEAVGRMPILAELVRVEGEGEARADIVAQCDGAQQVLAPTALALGHGERRRHDATAGVGQGWRVRIVGLVGVRSDTIGQRRQLRGGEHPCADDARLLRAAEGLDVVNRFSARQQLRPRHHRRDGVEQMVLRLLRDGVR